MTVKDAEHLFNIMRCFHFHFSLGTLGAVAGGGITSPNSRTKAVR